MVSASEAVYGTSTNLFLSKIKSLTFLSLSRWAWGEEAPPRIAAAAFSDWVFVACIISGKFGLRLRNGDKKVGMVVCCFKFVCAKKWRRSIV